MNFLHYIILILDYFVAAFTLEDELPDYDCDAEDLKWIETHIKKNGNESLTALEFEKMMDILEQGCGSRLDVSSFKI